MAFFRHFLKEGKNSTGEPSGSLTELPFFGDGAGSSCKTCNFSCSVASASEVPVKSIHHFAIDSHGRIEFGVTCGRSWKGEKKNWELEHLGFLTVFVVTPPVDISKRIPSQRQHLCTTQIVLLSLHLALDLEFAGGVTC